MFGLLATLIGVALATAGLLLIASGLRHTGYAGGASTLAATLLVGAGGTMVWWQQGPTVTGYLAQSAPDEINRLLEQAPPAAAPPASNDFTSRRDALVVAWGTPSDDDQAESDIALAYTRQLANEAAGQLVANGRTHVALKILARAEFQPIREGGLVADTWCKNATDQRVLALGLGANPLGAAGYAPWREPLYELLDCTSGQRLRRIGRVTERIGDAFPYQLAIRDEISALLTAFAQESR